MYISNESFKIQCDVLLLADYITYPCFFDLVCLGSWIIMHILGFFMIYGTSGMAVADLKYMYMTSV